MHKQAFTHFGSFLTIIQNKEYHDKIKAICQQFYIVVQINSHAGILSASLPYPDIFGCPGFDCMQF